MTIEEHIQAVVDTFEYWMDIHTDAQKWAESWLMDLDPQDAIRECGSTIGNDYFTFDWKKVAIRYKAKEELHYFARCSECGGIWESGFFDCCDAEEEELTKDDLEDLIFLYEDCEIELDDDHLLDALENEGFRVYREALENLTSPIESEIQDALSDYAHASSPTELLTWLTWVNHIWHVHGNIIEDYGDRFGLDYQCVNSISDGLDQWFDEDEIEEFLRE